MQTISPLRSMTLAGCGALVLSAASFACGATEPAVSALALSRDAWILRSDAAIGNPTTLAVLDGTRAVLVDAGFADTAPLIEQWLARHGATHVSDIATTHYHGDHTQGLEFFAARGTRRIATAAQRRRLATEPLLGPSSPPLAARALPELLLEGRLDIPVGEETLVLMTPPRRHAHTDGDLVARLERADVLYVGDHFFAGKFPIIDTAGGGDLWGYLDNLSWLVGLAGERTRFVAGHGTFAPEPIMVYDRAALDAWRRSLVATIELIRAMRDVGLSLEEAQARGLPSEYASFSERPRFVREPAWIETVYEALAEE
jgi:cyclase